jgi:IclR family transcriptional regulator, acetate operon repressor
MGSSRDKPIDGQYDVRAVHRVIDILEALQSAPTEGLPLQRLADAIGLPKTSTFRYLQTLQSRGYVEPGAGNAHYRLGLRTLALDSHRLELIADRARPYLARLRDRFGETVNLGVLEGNRVRYLEILESPRAMRLAARKGDRDPVHSTALGKAIALQLPEDRVRAVLAAEGMERLTDDTITDPQTYLRALQEGRERGYTLDRGENEVGSWCVAAPLLGGRLPTAISVSAPAMRISPDQAEAVASVVVATARELRQALVQELPEPEDVDA